jgi:hypothetical protein
LRPPPLLFPCRVAPSWGGRLPSSLECAASGRQLAGPEGDGASWDPRGREMVMCGSRVTGVLEIERGMAWRAAVGAGAPVMHPAVLGLRTAGWCEERAPTPGGERVANSLEPYMRSRATDHRAAGRQERTPRRPRHDDSPRPYGPAASRSQAEPPPENGGRVSTPSVARPSQAPEADACERAAALPLTQMHRTSGPNERNRPLSGTGGPARSRAPNEQDLDCLSQAQAMTASLTARSAVAREKCGRSPQMREHTKAGIRRPCRRRRAEMAAGGTRNRIARRDAWARNRGGACAGGSSHLPSNTHRQPRATGRSGGTWHPSIGAVVQSGTPQVGSGRASAPGV